MSAVESNAFTTEWYICSDHPKRAFDLRLISTAATEGLVLHFLKAAHANGSGARPWSRISPEGKAEPRLFWDQPYNLQKKFKPQRL